MTDDELEQLLIAEHLHRRCTPGFEFRDPLFSFSAGRPNIGKIADKAKTVASRPRDTVHTPQLSHFYRELFLRFWLSALPHVDGPPMVAPRIDVFFAKVLFGSSELELARSWISNMQSRSRRLVIMAVAAGLINHLFGLSTLSQAGTPDRVALSGHDPVSYFTPGHPEKGSPEFTYSFDDARYWFVSEEHRAMFAADPEHFAPQFAGYCAITVSRGAKYEADPEAWAIWNGKLFVFGSKDIVPDFNAHPGEIADKAKAAWATLNSK